MSKCTAARVLKTMLTTLLLSVAGHAPADSDYFVTHVYGVLISADDTYGGCMASLSVDPQSVLPSCAIGWVTFSCTGDFTDRVRAYRMVDQAQFAVATGNPVLMVIQDDKKHNGYCFVNRIDIYGP